MSSSLLSILFLTVFLSLSVADVKFRVSHQIAGTDLVVDVRVNGTSIPQFTGLSYGETSEYAVFPVQEEYLISVFKSGTDELIFNVSSEFAQLPATSSFFIAQEPEEFEPEGLVFLDLQTSPQQLFFNYRVLFLATTEDELDVYVDDKLVFKELDYDDETEVVTLGAGVHSFRLVNSTDDEEGLTFLETTLTLTAGNDYTIIVNFLQLTTDYQLSALIDSQTDFPCQIRAVNSVPSEDRFTIEINPTLTVSLGYTQFSDYLDLAIGVYTVVFKNATGAQIASTPLVCSSSARYTVFLAQDTDYIGGVISDSTFAPLINEATLRVVHFSSSPSASPATFWFQGKARQVVEFPDPSQYYSTDNVTASVALVANGLKFVDSTFDLKFGTSFSVFVFGLLDSKRDNDYPIVSDLVSDFETQSTTTTTTTTTTGATTGSTTGGDDDDDDGLSGGAIAGIVIGVLVGVALFGGLVWYVIKKHNSGKDTVYAQFEQH